MEYDKEQKKALGAFYTPQVLSDLLARLLVPLCKVASTSSITALDPATGDSILLESFDKFAQKKKIDVSLVGIDIDKVAVNNSRKKYEHNKSKCKFIHTDALYPLGNSIPSNGWDVLIQKYIPNGIDLIVSNPPWGADISHYISLSHDFMSHDVLISRIPRRPFLSRIRPSGL